jgi:hypothetical protein
VATLTGNGNVTYQTHLLPNESSDTKLENAIDDLFDSDCNVSNRWHVQQKELLEMRVLLCCESQDIWL